MAWILSIPLAVLLRYDFNAPASVVPWTLGFALLAGLTYSLVAARLQIYRGRYSAGSFDEAIAITLINISVGAGGTVVTLLLPATAFPRSAFVISTGVSTAIMMGFRLSSRHRLLRTALKRSGSRTLIYGAGDAGFQILSLILADEDSEYQPVGFIDDDPGKVHLRRAGVKVIGTRNELERIVPQLGVEILVVAISGMSSERLLDLDRKCAPMGVRVQVIPTASEIIGGAVRLGDISDLTDEDLLGRQPIQTNEDQIESFLRGKRILITGAGGSIGSEISRQVARYMPGEIYLLDRDESALYATQMSLDGSGTLESEMLLLADIRDRARMIQLFADTKPEVVFHAAALKHLPLLQRNPDEAYKTNVIGTLNVLEACRHAQVQVVVNISTDKAADPSSVLGYSKLLTERLTAHFAHEDRKSKAVSVRFGNVLGSRGSVINTFRHQIQNGGPVTVTDERVTRYFMTVREAVHLVLQASVVGDSGQTLILDMGQPKRILDVAEQMITRSGRKIDIVITGLRPGEKLDEALVARDEVIQQSSHPLISQSIVTGISPFKLPIELSQRDKITQLMNLATLRD